MLKQIGITATFLLLAVSPLIASAQTQSGTQSNNCPVIRRTLSLGIEGQDVAALQTYLGIVPASGYYGAKTQAAVIAWKKQNGIVPAIGSFGSLSRTWLNQHCGKTTSSTPVPNAPTTAVSNVPVPNVSFPSGFTVTPLAGQLPLSSIVSFTAGECTSYTLNWGDGSDSNYGAPSPCSKTTTGVYRVHRYNSVGNFAVTLTLAGGVTQTQHVVVSSASANNPLLDADVTWGTGPLSVRFTATGIPLSSYVINYGDGSTGNLYVSPTSGTGMPVYLASHTYIQPGTYLARISNSGSCGGVPCGAISSAVVTVVPAKQTPIFSFTPLAGTAPFDVSAYVTGAGVGTYTANFGDGSSTIMQKNCFIQDECDSYISRHTYMKVGSYTSSISTDLPNRILIGTSSIVVSGQASGPVRIIFMSVRDTQPFSNDPNTVPLGGSARLQFGTENAQQCSFYTANDPKADYSTAYFTNAIQPLAMNIGIGGATTTDDTSLFTVYPKRAETSYILRCTGAGRTQTLGNIHLFVPGATP